jgi:glycerol-3-phosphate dehydrogenase
MVQDNQSRDGAPWDYDLLVVGGGVNGAGVARDAAGRGLKVLLVERDDLAAHTSSASTKLIHGGLRYLEYYEFRLVREALQERERLIRIAPHISWPMRFVLPRPKGGRPDWMIRAGLWLYDHLGGKSSLPRSRAVDLREPILADGLKPGLKRGYVYSDAWVDDARLVALNALDAAERGATIWAGVAMTQARVQGEAWEVELTPTATAPRPAIDAPRTVRARAVVNAAGPWADEALGLFDAARAEGGVRLVKGSHIVVRKLYAGDHAFLLQNADGRVVFTIPYEAEFTLIGTTDVIVGEDQRARPRISAEETAYLCAAVSGYFERVLTPADVVFSYSGVRPLFDDGESEAKAITRDYVLKLGRDSGPQVLSVFGGKLTTYRRLAEHALEKLAPFLPPMRPAWTDQAPLPGGDLPPGGFDAFLAGVLERWPFLEEPIARRLAHAYGARIGDVLGDATAWSDLGEDFGGGLTEAEARYLVEVEWARSATAILWRRSKVGLRCDKDTPQRLADWLARSGLG